MRRIICVSSRIRNCICACFSICVTMTIAIYIHKCMHIHNIQVTISKLRWGDCDYCSSTTVSFLQTFTKRLSHAFAFKTLYYNQFIQAVILDKYNTCAQSEVHARKVEGIVNFQLEQLFNACYMNLHSFMTLCIRVMALLHWTAVKYLTPFKLSNQHLNQRPSESEDLVKAHCK